MTATTSKRELATRAVVEAARTRAKLKIDSISSVCPLEIAEELELVIQLRRLPSLEGMYSPVQRGVIVLSTQRPWGRIRHTCGHELAHHVFQHGNNVDELHTASSRSWNPQEYLADRFSTALTMPHLAVSNALHRRSWKAASMTPEQAFILSQDFGVGYSNFVSHAERTLRLVPAMTAANLRREARRLRLLRNMIAGFKVAHDVFVADEYWGARSLDVEIGDVIVVSRSAQFDGQCLSQSRKPENHLKAVKPGEGQLQLATRSSPIRVRVSRRGFTGLSRYRYMEDAVDE